MKIKWIIENAVCGGIRIVAGPYFSFIIDETYMYIRGSIKDNTSLKYVRIKERLGIKNWI